MFIDIVSHILIKLYNGRLVKSLLYLHTRFRSKVSSPYILMIILVVVGAGVQMSLTIALTLVFAAVSVSQYPITLPVAQSEKRLGSCTETPEIVTRTPKMTRPSAGNFSRLNNECASSWMNARPGRMYANGIAAKSP